jgi:excisionase family DNA binding protein
MLMRVDTVLSEKDKAAAREFLNAVGPFVASSGKHEPVTVTVQHRLVGIPEVMLDALMHAFRLVAEGHPIAVLALDDSDEVSAQEAAEILKVSRPYVLNLLKKGVLPFRMVGSHHRIPMNAVIAYKQDQAPRRRSLEALTAETQELGR